MLTTNIDLDEGTCSIDLLEAASEYFGLTAARGIIKVVAVVTATWRDTAKEAGAGWLRSLAWPAPLGMTTSSARWHSDAEAQHGNGVSRAVAG